MWTAISLALGVSLCLQETRDETFERLQRAVQAAGAWSQRRPVEGGPTGGDADRLEQELMRPAPAPRPLEPIPRPPYPAAVPVPVVPMPAPAPLPVPPAGFHPPGIALPPQDPLMHPETRRWLEEQAIRWAEARRDALRGRLAPWETERLVDIPWPSTAAHGMPLDPPWRMRRLPPFLPLYTPLTVHFSSDDVFHAFRRTEQAHVRAHLQGLTEARIPRVAPGDEDPPPAFEERWWDAVLAVRGATR